MPEFCKVEREGHLTIVTLNRPEVMNSLHPPANFELEAVFDEFAADPELWVAIITGAGDRAFSAGNDLKYTATHGGRLELNPKGFAGLTARYDNPEARDRRRERRGDGRRVRDRARVRHHRRLREGGVRAARAARRARRARRRHAPPAARDPAQARDGHAAHRPARLRRGGLPARLRERGGPGRRGARGRAALGRADPRVRAALGARVEAVGLPGPRQGIGRGGEQGVLRPGGRDGEERRTSSRARARSPRSGTRCGRGAEAGRQACSRSA